MRAAPHEEPDRLPVPQPASSRPGPAREQETDHRTTTDAPGEEMVEHAHGLDDADGSGRVPLFWNYLFCAWRARPGTSSSSSTRWARPRWAFKFSSWTLHMASIMIFSTLWGIVLKEWTGTSRYTKRLVALTLAGADRLDGDHRLRQLAGAGDDRLNRRTERSRERISHRRNASRSDRGRDDRGRRFTSPRESARSCCPNTASSSASPCRPGPGWA